MLPSPPHRRHVQLTQCGFHTPNHKLYRDVGSVELDDAKLILEGLGQNVEVRHNPSYHIH